MQTHLQATKPWVAKADDEGIGVSASNPQGVPPIPSSNGSDPELVDAGGLFNPNPGGVHPLNATDQTSRLKRETGIGQLAIPNQKNTKQEQSTTKAVESVIDAAGSRESQRRVRIRRRAAVNSTRRRRRAGINGRRSRCGQGRGAAGEWQCRAACRYHYENREPDSHEETTRDLLASVTKAVAA
jgi:hypothetical protein